MSVLLPDRAAELASAARLVAGWWARPLPEDVDAWERSWASAGEAALALGLERRAIDALADTLAAAEPAALLDEYERLFVGPGRVPCQPYESLWRDDAPRRERGMLMGTAATQVVALYRELGLAVSGEAHELPDHVAIEWEALAYAFETGAGEIAVGLLRDHLAVWLPPFCSVVEAEAAEPFYRELAGLTPLWASGLLAACTA